MKDLVGAVFVIEATEWVLLGSGRSDKQGFVFKSIISGLVSNFKSVLEKQKVESERKWFVDLAGQLWAC
jgi:hypothetical protein